MSVVTMENYSGPIAIQKKLPKKLEIKNNYQKSQGEEMRIEVRRMNNHDGYRISNGEKYVIVDNRLIDNIGYTEYDNSEDLFPLVDSIESAEAGDKFASLGEIPLLPEGSLVIHDDRVLIREEYCYLDLETRKPISHAYDVTVHRVGY